MPRKRWEKITDRAVAPVVLVAIVASYVVSNQESKDRDRAQAKQLVTACVKNSYRTGLGAAGWNQLSLRVRERGNPGDERSADIYKSVSVGMAAQIAAPEGLTNHGLLVRAVYNPATKKLALTPATVALQKRGCEQAYG